MKRVFQWGRYLNWKNLSSQEKLTLKRLLFIPIIAYFLLGLISRYSFALICCIGGYLLYQMFSNGKLKK